MKGRLSLLLIAVSVNVFLTGCRSELTSVNPQSEAVTDNGTDWETVSFSQSMGDYSINMLLSVRRSEENDGYDADINASNIFVADNDGNTVSSMPLNNPWFGGENPGSYDINFTFEPISFNSGNLLFIGTPVKNDVPAHCLSIYYFDNSIVNFIGYSENGGDFFPLISGDISADGDTFTLSEIDTDGGVSEVTYIVDFEKKVIIPK